MYVDGIEDPASPTAIAAYGSLDISDKFFIGAGTAGTGGSPGNFFNGSVKHVGVWTRALSSTEVQNVMYKTYGQLAGTETQGLVSWWALDSSSDTYNDSHGSNNGTNSGSTLQDDIYGGYTPKIPRAVDNAPTARADMIGNGSASFTASNSDYIATGATFQTTLDGAFTVTAWIKPDDGQPSATGAICGSSSTSDEDRFAFMLNTSGKLGVLYKSNAGAGEMDDFSTSAVFSDGATDWTHVALTVTESGGTVTGTIYVNGVSEAGSYSGSGPMANFVTTYNFIF